MAEIQQSLKKLRLLDADAADAIEKICDEWQNRCRNHDFMMKAAFEEHIINLRGNGRGRRYLESLRPDEVRHRFQRYIRELEDDVQKYTRPSDSFFDLENDTMVTSKVIHKSVWRW